MLGYLQFPNWLSAEIIPGLPFRWYGMMYLVAFAISYFLFSVQVRQRKLDLDKDLVLNWFFWAIIGMLIGARLFAALIFESSGFYRQRPWLIFWPFYNGKFTGLQGMNYYGGVVGAVVAVLIYSRAKKINVLEWGDMLLTGVPLRYTFGRLGNFINAELYGRVTKASWGFVFPTAQPFSASENWVRDWASDVGIFVGDEQALVNLPRHPTQIYEGVLEGIVLWLILWFVVRKRKPYDGFIIGLYIILYGVMRFIVDYFRMPISAADFAIRLSGDLPVYFVQSALNLIPSQLFSLAMIVGGSIFLVFANRLSQRNGGLDGSVGGMQGKGAKPSMRKLRRKAGQQ